MKFCPEFGSQLPIGTAKFCPNCGKSLWVTTSETNDSDSGSTDNVIQSKEITASFQDSFKEIPKGEEIRGEFQEETTYSLGIKLEETVELILKKRGYTTEMRLKLEGNSGALNEIDVLVKRQNKVRAVECKNYKESRLVGIKEIRDFESKILDLPYITDAMFVTNTRFSSEAETYAKHTEITLYDGEKLKNEFYLMSIGRLDSSSPSSADIPQQDIILEFALPLTMNYRQATRLDLVNSYSAKISYAALILRPFCVFNYIIDVKRRLLIGRRLHEEGTHIVDAMTGEILSIIENIESKIQSYPFFSKRNVRPKDSDEILGDIEKIS
ncbi:MAG: restriction endonuclease [Nitrososphaeraceae archaeon]|nr:restriction endonuclease [Nitrososphaeraceae archaeon]MBV9668517.1 restriction endonuclease [Nitrososphaeraceae archaeon]